MDITTVNSSSLPWTEAFPANFISPLPSTSLSPALPTPLPTIIVVICLFLIFAVCVSFLAVCRPSAQAVVLERGRCPGDPIPCSPSLSGEPQLKLWKRLGSMRLSLTSSFRRPPQRRQDRGPSAPAPLPPHLSLPCLYGHVTEI